MIISVYVPLIAALVIGRCFRWRRFLPGHPAFQTWTVTIVSVVTATMSTWSLVLLATARIDRVAYVTERVHLIGVLLRRSEHVPLAVSLLAVLLLAIRGCRVGRVLVRARRARRAADRFRSTNIGALVVVADENPIAFALVASRHYPATIVLSTAVFATVPAEQRRAVLAHEQAHLALRHHAHRGAVNIAVALEPFLSPAGALSGSVIERWADEHAATDSKLRRTAADAIGTFVRLTTTPQRVGYTPPAAQLLGGLAYDGHAAAGRIEALLYPAPPRRIIHFLPVAVETALIVSAAGDATQQLARLVHAAIR